jgi:hypothetical protein
VTTDFMKNVISDMNLDLDAEAMEDILNSLNKDAKKEDKKDDEDKEKK